MSDEETPKDEAPPSGPPPINEDSIIKIAPQKMFHKANEGTSVFNFDPTANGNTSDHVEPSDDPQPKKD